MAAMDEAMTAPRVSVVIPTARRPLLVRRAVESVLGQSLLDLEVIVVLDGRDADTLASLATLSDPRLRLLVNERPLGACGARNAGAAAARGCWLGFLDDDDEWLPNKLERQLAGRPAGEADGAADVVVTCLSHVVTPTGRYLWPRRLYDGSIPLDEYLFDRRSLLKGDAFIQTSSLLLPARLFRALGFSALHQHEEWDLLLRAVKREGAALVMVPEALVVHYAEGPAASLSAAFAWRDSLAWISSLEPLVTRRALSGFCLTVVAPQPARAGEYGAFLPLLGHAWRHGAPTALQMLLFLVIWSVPMGLRQSLRGLWHQARTRVRLYGR